MEFDICEGCFRKFFEKSARLYVTKVLFYQFYYTMGLSL